jgi:alcohol dehydrogenase
MNANSIFSMRIPTNIIFGCGELKRLATEKLPGKKAMIVISSGNSMKKYGYLDKVITYLNENNQTGSIVFDKIMPNPIKSHVMEAAAICREEKCDFIIGLGGGSSIDSAKAIAVMACNKGDFWDYVSGGSGKGREVQTALPIVAIPTTAGTGTEADPWAVITNEDTQEKIGFGCTLTFPTLSIIDPSLMLSIPPHLTAYQGFDAFFHAAEGFIANCATPISDLYALEAIRLLYKYLPVAVNDGKDLKARAKVAWGSTLAGLVEATSSCTSEHSLEHAMSAYYPQLPHGAGLIALSEPYFETFRNDCMKRYMKMAEIMTQQKSNRPSDFIDALHRMKKECHVDNIKLSDWGLKKEDFPRMAQNARDTMGGLFTLDPRPLTDDDIMNIYQKAYK